MMIVIVYQLFEKVVVKRKRKGDSWKNAFRFQEVLTNNCILRNCFLMQPNLNDPFHFYYVMTIKNFIFVCLRMYKT